MGGTDLSASRGVGCWATPGLPSFTLDVLLTGARKYRLAAYFVDWDGRGRQQTLSLMDFATKNVVSPTQLVEDFARGRWLVWEYHDSVRIRINARRGDNAVVSALLFDD